MLLPKVSLSFNNNNNNIYDLYRAYTGGSMRHYNDKMKQYIELEVK